MKFDYFFQFNHRRLREKFKWETIMHHEVKIITAMAKRRDKQRERREEGR